MKANRHQRRARVRQLGATWQRAKRMSRDRKAEAALAAKASRLTPEQARKALAEWARRGGDGQPMPQSGDIPVAQ